MSAEFTLRRADGSEWKRLLYIDFALAVAARDSSLSDVGPLSVEHVSHAGNVMQVLGASERPGYYRLRRVATIGFDGKRHELAECWWGIVEWHRTSIEAA